MQKKTRISGYLFTHDLHKLASKCITKFISKVLHKNQGDHLSGKPGNVREMSGILLTVRELSGECQGKNLVREKCPKSVHY